MKSVLWLLVGVIGGFIIAHFLNKDPRGHEILSAIDTRLSEFTGIASEAYREQEARLLHPEDK